MKKLFYDTTGVFNEADEKCNRSYIYVQDEEDANLFTRLWEKAMLDGLARNEHLQIRFLLQNSAIHEMEKELRTADAANNYEKLQKVAKNVNSYPYQRQALAMNRNTPPEILDILAHNHTDRFLYELLMLSPSLTEETAAFLIDLAGKN